MGHRVVFYERDVPYYARRRDLTSSDFCELVLYPSWNEIRVRALADLHDSDVVINSSYCPEGITICDDALAVSRPLHVFYDLDTPVTLQGLANGGVEYLRADQVPGFNLYLSWCGGEILDELEQRWGACCARPLYGCVDPEVHTRVDVPERYRCAMSYMGTHSVDRQGKFERLFLATAEGKPEEMFVLAGSQYPQQTWPGNVRHFEHVSPHDHPALYSSSRFTLNITRDGMARAGYCPSGRLFEAAACGTPIVSDWFAGLDHFFTPGEEIFVAHDTSDALLALGIGDTERTKIARRAREHAWSEHTGDQRARELIVYLEQARSRRHRSSSSVAEAA